MENVFVLYLCVVSTLAKSLWIKKISLFYTRRLQIYFLLSTIVFTACSPLTKYINDPNNLHWENEIQEFQVLDSTEIYSDDAILFAGSSSIRLWNSINEDMQPYSVIQRGYGGAKLSDFALYAEEIIYPHNFKALVIFIANDISGSDNDKTPEVVAGLFEYIVDIVREKYPTTPIFWIQITPTLSRWAEWDKIEKSNNIIKQYCEDSENLHFIETEKLFLNNDGLPNSNLFIEDQLHLNKDGYDIWTRKIKTELNAVLK